jgi:hypothetical protein
LPRSRINVPRDRQVWEFSRLNVAGPKVHNNQGVFGEYFWLSKAGTLGFAPVTDFDKPVPLDLSGAEFRRKVHESGKNKTLGKVIPLMTLTNNHPRSLLFAFFLLIILGLSLQTTVVAKKRHDSKPARSARGAKNTRLSARERRAAKRSDRLSARESRRGGKSKLSRKEQRRESARDQAAQLKALERRLHRPLTRR